MTAPRARRCVHCDRGVTDGEHPVHTEGRQRGLMRCDPADSRLAYGHNAHAHGTDCQTPCLGADHVG